MKKTLDINIAGQLFRVDEDAWEVLKHYLDHVSARFKSEQGADETLADIEARIAEIVREKALELLSEEVPHGIGVGVEKIGAREGGRLTDVYAIRRLMSVCPIASSAP